MIGLELNKHLIVKIVLLGNIVLEEMKILMDFVDLENIVELMQLQIIQQELVLTLEDAQQVIIDQPEQETRTNAHQAHLIQTLEVEA